MIRPTVRLASLAALVALSLPLFQASAQQTAPAADASATAPSGPVPTAAPVFPKPDPANFTAALPTKETVNAFLQTNWGYDDSRLWQVQAILKTPAEGVSRVYVLVGDKAGKQKVAPIQFFVLPDGKHILANDDILTFGEHPYAEARALLQQRADGPYRGAATKELEIVEFADFQCPHCKVAQANVDQLATDFPKAHIVFQNLPLSQHLSAARAAEYGVCVAKLGGSNAFSTFASAVFEGQDGLATVDGATLTLNSAVAKAGLDPVKVADCAATPATKATVVASVKLAKDLNVNQTPTLLINGRPLPLGEIPYETIKQIVLYQAKLDGVVAQ